MEDASNNVTVEQVQLRGEQENNDRTSVAKLRVVSVRWFTKLSEPCTLPYPILT
jgi:hypothetical protein